MEVLASGWLTLGPRTREFEAAFAEHLGVRHAVAVSSCTAALHLAYLAAGVGPGDEVIVPSMTFAATAAAVIYCGGTPVFADIARPARPRARPRRRRARASRPRTKAVCAVHFAGYPAAVDRLRALCDAHGLALIEDAAHAPSADVDGRKLGTWGLRRRVLASSPTRSSSCGEGGLLATDDDDVAALARSLRSHGHDLGHLEPPDARDRLLRRRRPRLQLPPRRAALGAAALAASPGSSPRSSAGASSRAPTARSSPASPHVLVPYDDAGVERSSCYVMPVAASTTTAGATRCGGACATSTASRPRSSIPPCTSSPPTASASASRACRSTERVARDRDHDPAVRPPRRGRRRTASSARCAEALA